MGQHPILLYSGEICLQTQSGKLTKTMLTTHNIANNFAELKTEELRELLGKNLKLGQCSFSFRYWSLNF